MVDSPGPDDGEEHVLEGGPPLDVLDPRRRQQRLSSASVPFAMIRPSWRIAIRSASCSASSSSCVVSSTVVPARGELSDRVPDLEARLRVQPGGRLVEEDDGGIPDRLIAMSSRRRMPPE